MKTMLDSSKVIKCIISIICIFFIICSIFLITKDVIADKNSLTVTATIKAIDYSNSNGLFNIEYKVNNEYYENNINLNDSSNLTVNDQIDIKVNQKKPQYIITSHLFIYATIFSIALVLLAICGPSSLKYYKDIKNIKKIKSTGTIINASIIEVVINNNGHKKDGLLPSYLRCSYLNPTDNITYTVESKESYQNLQDIITRNNIKTITIYLDRANTNNYYVDLDSICNEINLLGNVASKEENKKEGNNNEQ